MQIIPVLDLSNGLVVHAKLGGRVNYKPIVSQLCPTSNAIDIIHRILDIYSFKCIYIADLDALQKQGDNIEIVKSINFQFQNLEIWLDTGVTLIKHYLENLKINPIRLILSSEAIDSKPTLDSVINNYSYHDFIYSIDYISDNILGLNILAQVEIPLPANIIVLNLDKVGSNQGIKVPALPNLHSLLSNHNVYYGGGIRNDIDLNKLKDLGFSGALISSALHNKEITHDDLCLISQ